MAKLTAEERRKLPDSDFALSGRRYPIHDEAHARDALARASGKPEEDEVRAAVKKRWPGIEVAPKKAALIATTDSSSPRFAGRMMFAIASDPRPEIPVPDGQPAKIGGEPCHYFEREICHAGDFKHPVQQWSIHLDPPVMAGLAERGNDMLAHGVPIPIVEDHKEQASKALGYIKNFRADGNTLFGLYQLIGDDAAKIAARNYVSPCFDDKFTSGDKTTWNDVITHVALTPAPVFTNQDRKRMAASLSAGVGEMPFVDSAEKSFWSKIMDGYTNYPCSDADGEMLCSMIDGLGKVPKEHFMSHVARHMANMHKMVGGGRMMGSLAADPANPTLPAPVEPKIPTGEDADFAVEAATSRFEKAKAKTPLSEAAGKAMFSLLVKTDKGEISPLLGLKIGEKRASMAILDVLGSNEVPAPAADAPLAPSPSADALKLGSQTPPQSGPATRFMASRVAPGGNGADTEKAKLVHETMLSAANSTAKDSAPL
jgi:hypothetical protein